MKVNAKENEGTEFIISLPSWAWRDPDSYPDKVETNEGQMTTFIIHLSER